MANIAKPPEITLVLDRLRSAHNTGNIFRIAEAVGAKEIIACGYTPAPPHPKLAKTAMNADQMVPCRQAATSLEAVKMLRTEGVRQILAVESGPEESRPGSSIMNFRWRWFSAMKRWGSNVKP